MTAFVDATAGIIFFTTPIANEIKRAPNPKQNRQLSPVVWICLMNLQ